MNSNETQEIDDAFGNSVAVAAYEYIAACRKIHKDPNPDFVPTLVSILEAQIILLNQIKSSV